MTTEASIRGYRARLAAADLSAIDQLRGLLGLIRKITPMLLRGLLLRPWLRRGSRTPFVGHGVRVRGAGQLQVGRRVIFEDYSEIQATSARGVILGDNVSVGSMTMIRPSGYYSRELGVGLQVGSRTGIGAGCYLGCSGGIEIGSDVLFGPGVKLFAEDHVFSSTEERIRAQGVTRGPIVIEDDCWLASGVIVTSGVRIGRGTVVGAGSVVTRDLPEFSVAAGNPAKVIRSRLAQT